MSEVPRKIIPIQSADAEDGDAAVQVVSLYQKQKKIYPRAVSGWFMGWRWALVWFTQLVFYGLPWLEWNGRQAVLFDLAARRFYIFGLVLYPQDFIYLTTLLVISALGLFFFTAVAGRLWCGYACPQTVYTEIFMWVEQKIEGDRVARMRLDKAPWTFEKIWRKTAKQAVWIAIGLWTGFTFVGYFTPIKTLAASALSFGFGPWEWFWVLFYGFATYGNAGYMREQVCKYMCPYARFQSAMFDKDTMIITYDEQRGEPRGSRSRKADPKQLGLGDCIDCTLCVQVCPTGIDIRNGLQYECIGCAACIDVCNGVMDKMGYARGLIRYSTQNGMANRWSRAQMFRRVLRPRVLIYGAILLAISIAFVVSIALRSPFKVDVIRDRGALARIVEDGYIENVYRLQVMNGTEAVQRYRVSVDGLPGLAVASDPQVEVGPAEARWLAVRVQLPPEAGYELQGRSSTIWFHIERLASDDEPARTVTEKSTFLVPR
ncbi:cytochrome c oxidase accessory protein CcoG [Caldimonas thermodepolymerans]|uniref:Cytochrome c oxidase accessory protein CcoG n=1 Tax=Caldimonas thermodepolymerans TaxID=215580 RepID=A0A2S5T5T4_9BURK|nr:cytochrome c oxidase accessory protein CcoG [Caldimonas thermodepolymerans]PPE70341.1 cytochrome c oxidase accessory protein CcoG [Caldimonas thermodepolymerans]QPC30251.1 cytochrome c oxidase accessory protein CcoG [Caldimonas thermodepolymerans]RDI00639.1 cytochrome c oxidase accessory protein FixG [Caldimonas thermodepolymerans]TCP07082.1 cytochrome c oxidase accessory protein FixG [Caldimonas thermodepolymerans]UZG46674.1 cytochrome c oxidase accessory protein CcoG [Caldimonas thermodep